MSPGEWLSLTLVTLSNVIRCLSKIEGRWMFGSRVCSLPNRLQMTGCLYGNMSSVFVLRAICLCKIKDRPCCQKRVGLGNQCFRSTQQRNLYHGQAAWACKQVSHVEKPEQPILAVLLSHRTALLPEEKKREEKKGGRKALRIKTDILGEWRAIHIAKRRFWRPYKDCMTALH